MITVPKRLAIKFSFKQNPTTPTQDIVPVFQRWIQEHTVDGMLIDVIDYKHVQNGPGILLIADEGDYGYDLGDGQVGLKYTRKRALPENLQDALRLVFRLGFLATQQLENEDVLDDAAFDYSSAQISLIDRQSYPNTSATFKAIQDEISTFLSGIYGETVSVTRASDDIREVFAVNYTVVEPIDAATIEKILNQYVPV